MQMDMNTDSCAFKHLILNKHTIHQIKIIKRCGETVSFNVEKISIAMTKAFIAVEGNHAATSNRIHEKVKTLSDQVASTFIQRMPSGGTLHLEEIQDQVELVLMRNGDHKVAQAYVIYRAEHAQQREDLPFYFNDEHPPIHIVDQQGYQRPLDVLRLNTLIHEACKNLEGVEAQSISESVLNTLYDGMPVTHINTSLVSIANALTQSEPNYTFVSARFLLDKIRQEALHCLGLYEQTMQADMQHIYPQALTETINKGIINEQLSSDLRRFDLRKLGQAIESERDLQFTYNGLQTLSERYLMQHNEMTYELPQIFFMRVAMGLALEEDDINTRAIEFYQLLSSFDYMCDSNTLLNSGTLRPQLSSSYLSTAEDDIHGIYDVLQNNAVLSKWGGGSANDWSNVRASGAKIQGIHGISAGIIPFLNIANASVNAFYQGKKPKEAVCAYLESWHLDIEAFLALRKDTDQRGEPLRSLNIANWVPDLFMKRVIHNKKWTLFSPEDVTDLHELFGNAFEQRYQHYEKQAEKGEIIHSKVINAQDLWRQMLERILDTGEPWITFKDPCNIRSAQQHVGVVHCSSVHTETTLNTSKDESAACTLGSVNLANHIENGQLNPEKLKHSVKTAIRMLDNSIDINYYAIKQAHTSNMRHRPVGLGLMGFQDALYKLDLCFASQEALEFSDLSLELLSYYAIHASSELARERSSYPSYEGSLWSQGILPIDSIKMLAAHRGSDYLDMHTNEHKDWESLREKIKIQGLRNASILAIGPMTEIANIISVHPAIEPNASNLQALDMDNDEGIMINPFLVQELQQRNLWDSVMIHDLTYYKGSVQSIERIPKALKAKFASAFEIDPLWVIHAASHRQKWIDQAQSLNFYLDTSDIKILDNLYRVAWKAGLKTTYRVHTTAPTYSSSNHLDRTHSSISNKKKGNTVMKKETINKPFQQHFVLE